MRDYVDELLTLYPNANFEGIPDYMRESLAAYVVSGRRTGSFLEAVLSNDLLEAASRGDELNMRALYDYARFLYNYAPGGCYGSPENYEAWVKSGGMNLYHDC